MYCLLLSDDMPSLVTECSHSKLWSHLLRFCLLESKNTAKPNISVVWITITCNPLGDHRCFEGTCCLHLQDKISILLVSRYGCFTGIYCVNLQSKSSIRSDSRFTVFQGILLQSSSGYFVHYGNGTYWGFGGVSSPHLRSRNFALWVSGTNVSK